ncbi:DUF596 domain-containing protein [Xylella fastidiosa]|uniref:DUF596 domain-containing protein n=1 Tax=Xylella fastidiosa TaxID=2371 RepID=UPI00073395FC|nr:DUF596 domain-containing protein [Xylella fastidiosa]
MLTQEQIDEICEDLGGPLNFLWGYIGDAYGVSSRKEDPESFEERKNDFFFIIGKLLDEGLLKLGNRKGGLFTGTTAELVEMFRECFPASDEELLTGLWLVTEDCQFIAVWVHKGEGVNGEDYHEWAD